MLQRDGLYLLKFACTGQLTSQYPADAYCLLSSPQTANKKLNVMARLDTSIGFEGVFAIEPLWPGLAVSLVTFALMHASLGDRHSLLLAPKR